jgi:hypothetical protein
VHKLDIKNAIPRSRHRRSSTARPSRSTGAGTTASAPHARTR